MAGLAPAIQPIHHIAVSIEKLDGRLKGGHDETGGQNSPAIWPLPSRPIISADGTLGRPGIVMMSPQMTTMNSAPADSRTSRIGTTWFDGAPLRLGSVENEYCVFAMQIGNLP